ncbi:MAG: GNAT family N-acetyltransferase [Microthrixaceae bacterium]
MGTSEGDAAMPRLRTARLVLRDWREADLAPFGELNADPVVMEHFPTTLDDAANRALVERLRRRWREEGRSWWVVEESSTGSFVGAVGLLSVDFAAPFHDLDRPATEVGWRLARHAWGRGYATEAAHAALQWGWTIAGLSEVLSFTSTGNVRSRRVMERLGMTRDPAGDFDHPRVVAGSPLRRHVLYRVSSPVAPPTQ